MGFGLLGSGGDTLYKLGLLDICGGDTLYDLLGYLYDGPDSLGSEVLSYDIRYFIGTFIYILRSW